MFSKIKTFFDSVSEQLSQDAKPAMDPKPAIAALLCQVTQADHKVEDAEKSAMVHQLCGLLSIEASEAQALIDTALVEAEQATSVYQFTDELRDLSYELRFDLIESMWQVAFADNELDPIEEAVIRKAAELLYVDHHDFIRAKLKVTGQ